MKYRLLYWAAWFVPCFGYGQNDDEFSKQMLIEQRIELIAEEQGKTEIDFTTLFDELSSYYDQPLNLNKVSSEDLQQLYLLSDFQILQLCDHIARNGNLISIEELQTVEGFDQKTIKSIIPFVKVSTDPNLPHIGAKQLFNDGKHELYLRYIRILEKQKGFKPIDDSTLASNPNKRYLGSADRLYLRYRFKYSNKISWGLTAEKDEGEQFFSGTQPHGFDFYSAHLFLKGIGKLKHVAIGDYQAQFGQGLTLWSGWGFTKSSFVMSIKKNPLGLKPYTSVDENEFLRGSAVTVALGKLEITSFYSNKFIDGNIISDDSTSSDEITVSSFQNSGFHATQAEVYDKDAIKEIIYGGHLSYTTHGLNVGATMATYEYSGLLNRNNQPYNQFEFNGSKNTNLGLDYSYIVKNFNFFGEIAHSQPGGVAYLAGGIISLDPNLSLSLLHRNYQRNYQALYSSALAESNRNTNETGTYFGIEARPINHITLTAYFDKFRFPWLRYLTHAPSEGVDYLTQVKYQPNKQLELYVRYKHEINPRNTKADVKDIKYLVNTDKQNLRVNITYKVSEALRLRSRAEGVRFIHGEQNPEYGYLVFQDVIYKSIAKPYSFSFRYGLFDTDSYNSRIYAYEHDVLYYYYIPAYYYRGTRTQLTFRYTFTHGVDLWIRFAQTYLSNRSVVSSGLREIEGNTKSEIKAQLRLKF